MSRLQQFIKLPFLSIGRGYNKVAQKHPFATGVVTTVVKTSAADLFAQRASASQVALCLLAPLCNHQSILIYV